MKMMHRAEIIEGINEAVRAMDKWSSEGWEIFNVQNISNGGDKTGWVVFMRKPDARRT